MTDTTHNATLPNYLTTYYWRVKTTNTTGNSDWSDVWELLTTQMPAPNQPILNTPMDNAVKTQIWIVVSNYVLVNLIKNQLNSTYSTYEILEILNDSLFEQVPLNQLLIK